MVFFSYCQKDKIVLDWVKKFENKNKEIKYFLDVNDNKYEEEYWKNIKEQLDKSEIFVFFNSSNYIKSGSCSREYLKALKLEAEGRIKILEVQIEESGIFKTSPDKLYIKINDEINLSKWVKNLKEYSKNIENNKKKLEALNNIHYILLDYLDKLRKRNKKFLKNFFELATNDYENKCSWFEKFYGSPLPYIWEEKINIIFNKWLKCSLIISIENIGELDKKAILSWANSSYEYDFIPFLSMDKHYKKAKKYEIKSW